jgi:integrase
MRSDNPCRGVERYPETPRERHLTRDELVSLSRALDEDEDQQAVAIFRLLLLTGARKSELCSACWSEFRLEPDCEPPSGVWTKPASNTKQKKTHRIPLSAQAVTLFNEIGKRPGVAVLPGSYVFPYGAGFRSNLRAPWRRVCRAADLGEGLRIYDLRHSYASILAGQGLSLLIIGRLLGHSVATTTARYAHLLDDPLRQATSLVGAVVASARGVTRGS